MSTTTTTKVRTAPAISTDAEDFAAKVRAALSKSVGQGVGEVRVKVADASDRADIRRVQKRVQAIGYSSGYNANFRVTLAGDILTGRVVDLTVTDQRPGHTDPTAKTPGTRSTFHGWTPAQVTAWREAHPVTAKGETKVTPKVTAKKVTPKKVTTVRKVTAKKVTPTSLSGVTSATPVDTTTVTTRKVTPKKS